MIVPVAIAFAMAMIMTRVVMPSHPVVVVVAAVKGAFPQIPFTRDFKE